MDGTSLSRRAVLAGLGGASVLGTAGLATARRLGPGGTSAGTQGIGQPAGSECTPGHTDGDPACKQVRNDRDVRIRFDGAETSLLTTFEYPCGWQTSTTDQYDDRTQANVTRSDIGPEEAYVDVQIRNYHEPVEEGFLDAKQAEGNYDEVDYAYAGTTRTGLLSSADSAQYGTLAHAVVPGPAGDERRHVELVSTMQGAECPSPRPDYLLVKKMLQSLEPNPGATVRFEDQSVSGEVQTQSVVVHRAFLRDGGYVGIYETPLQGDDLQATLVGASSYLSAGVHPNVLVALDENVSAETELVAIPHHDTDGDNVFEFGERAGLDEPYTNADGSPVSDSATVSVMVDTPVPTEETRSPTPEPHTPTPSPTPTSSQTPKRSPSPTPMQDGSPTNPATGEDTPGFGVGAALTGLTVAGVSVLRRRLQDRQP